MTHRAALLMGAREGVHRDDTRSFFDYQEEGRARGEEVNFALVEPDDPLLVLGGSSVYDIDLRQGRAAVGFWVAAAARGRGVATHATRLMAK